MNEIHNIFCYVIFLMLIALVSWQFYSGSRVRKLFSSRKSLRHDAVCCDKLISRLERLGVRLLNRSTRQFQLTSEGCQFYEQGSHILNNLDELEQSVTANHMPKGRIRIHTSLSYWTHTFYYLVFLYLTSAVSTN